MRHIIYFLSGCIFASGLQIAQMVDPKKVIGFLDISGQWDPSLVLVLASALFVFAVGYHLLIKPKLIRQQPPAFADDYSLPKKTSIDRELIIGAAIFGVGWGLSGLCPGPALANLINGELKIAFFIILMLIGMALAQTWTKLNLSKLNN